MFYGWYVVISGCMISLYISGVIILGFTAVFEPLAAEFGWSYTQISLAASMRGLEQGFLIPLAGWLLDKWGPRLVIMGGIFLSGLGLVGLSQVENLWQFYGSFLLIAAGTSVGTSFMMMAVVAGLFKRNYGLAMGLIASGTALGGLVVPGVTGMIDWLGWRQTMLILGLGAWLIPMPLTFVFRSKKNGTAEVQQAEAGPGSAGLKSILTDRSFWLITSAFTLHVSAVVAIITHIMPYLGSVGYSRTTAALAAATLPMVSVVGRILFGWLGDTRDKRLLTWLVFGLSIAGLFFLWSARVESPAMVWIFCVLHGLGWGGMVPLMSSLLRQYYGPARIGTVLGISAGLMTFGVMFGAPAAGWVFDTWGTYRPVWPVFAGMIALAGLLMIGLSKSERD